MAEIRKRGDTYQISVFLGRDESGKKLYQRTTYSPKATTPKAISKEVENYANEYEKRVKDGDIYSGEGITFRDFVEIWKANCLSNLTERVKDEYQRQINVHFLPKFGHITLSKIRATHIDSVLNEMKSAGKAPKTIRYSFTAINSVMKYAFKKGYIKENPCVRCDDLPKVERDNELHYFTVEQAKTFLHALTLEYEEKRAPVTRQLKDGRSYEIAGYTMSNTIPFQWRVYFNLAIYGGFRRGELLALTWEDIDELNHTVSISKAISRSFTQELTKAPKTQASVREIVLPAESFALLSVWKNQQRVLADSLGTAWKGYRKNNFNRNYIFITNDGARMCLDTPTHKFKEIIEMYNSQKVERDEDKLPDIRLHDLRHTSATLLLANSVDIETVSKRLGHSKASITLDVYGHAMKEKDITASATLERLFA